MQPLCKGAEIFLYYAQLALEKVMGRNLVVLKTDLYNESEVQSNNKNILKLICPLCEKCCGIEIDKEIFRKAYFNMRDFENLEMINGSIEQIPIDDNSVDLLLDFSTIDHIWEYENALSEYQRVVKPDGEIIIISWLAEGDSKELYKNQYCFNRGKFERDLRKFFVINNSKLLLVNSQEERNLIEYDLGILER